MSKNIVILSIDAINKIGKTLYIVNLHESRASLLKINYESFTFFNNRNSQLLMIQNISLLISCDQMLNYPTFKISYN